MAETFSLNRARYGFRLADSLVRPEVFFDQLVDRYGDLVLYRAPFFKFYLVNHPTLVKQLLMKTHRDFDKQTVLYDRFRNVFGRGLVVAEGEDWKRKRALLQPLFGARQVERFFETMVQATEARLKHWRTDTAFRAVFDVSRQMNQLTLEIAGRCFFGEDFADSASDVHRWTQVINRYCARPPTPVSGKLWFPSPINLHLKQTLAEFHAFIRDLVSRRRKDPAGDDLLSLLLTANRETEGSALPEEEIVDEILGMLIGGHETSANALTWLWYELDRVPGIRETLTKEAFEVLSNQRPQVDQIKQLRYTRMVIEETLRLHPPFWFENRNAKTDVELGGVTIPQGSMIVFSRYSLHRHRDFWKDRETFSPERFSPEAPENERSLHASVPFGGGPRVCIGTHFAMMQMILSVAMIAREYELRVHPSDRHAVRAKLTLEPRYGVKVKLRPAAG